MVKVLVGAVIFLTLLEEVISCEYPIVESIVIGGLVLLVAAAWSDSGAGNARSPRQARAQRPVPLEVGPRSNRSA